MPSAKWSKSVVAIGALGLVLLGVRLVRANTFPSLPPEKQALEDRIATEQAAASALPAQKPEIPQPPLPSTSRPTPPLTPGIFEERQAPFSPSQILVNNRWQGDVNGLEAIVFAGEYKDPSQGVVVVLTRRNGRMGDMVSYFTPTKSGGVRVVAEKSGYLTLKSAGGNTYTFDIAAGSFVQE